MEEEYWRRFLETGKIMDYLYYKGMTICKEIMDSYTAEAPHHTCFGGANGRSYGSGENGESGYSDRYGACGDACW